MATQHQIPIDGLRQSERSPQVKVSPLAVFALVFSGIGVLSSAIAAPFSALPALLGIVVGSMAAYRLRSEARGESGMPLAVAAIVIGFLALPLAVLLIGRSA